MSRSGAWLWWTCFKAVFVPFNARHPIITSPVGAQIIIRNWLLNSFRVFVRMICSKCFCLISSSGHHPIIASPVGAQIIIRNLLLNAFLLFCQDDQFKVFLSHLLQWPPSNYCIRCWRANYHSKLPAEFFQFKRC